MHPSPASGSERSALGQRETGSSHEVVEVPTGINLYRAIRQAIVSLQFAPGQQLSENELARRFHASRTPIRDALKRLEREELVIISPRRKTTVTKLDLATFRQFVIAREALESTAAQMAARQTRPKRQSLISSATELAAHIDKSDDSAFLACDRRFHLQIMRIADMEKVHEIVESLRGLTDRIRFAHMMYLATYDRASVVRQHREIAEAIAMGDVNAAGTAMHTHILSVLERVVQLARMRPDLFSANLKDELGRLEDSWRK